MGNSERQISGDIVRDDLDRPIVYMDNHATTQVDPRVLDAMLPWFSRKYGNASSVNHFFGREAAAAVDAAREQAAALLNIPPRSLVFTSGATEANNLALKGVLRASGSEAHLITTAAEHRSVLDPARRLKRLGFGVTVLPVDRFGRIDPGDVEQAIRPGTVLVSVIYASNEVGTINDVAAIGEVCRARGVLFHTDAVQAVGKLPIDLNDLPIDLLSLSAHKLYGPKGVGVLYVRRGEPRIAMEPLFDGGGQEGHLRSGTLAVPQIVGLGRTCEIAGEESELEVERIGALRDRLWNGLQSELSGLRLNGDPEHRLAGNLNVSFESVDGEALSARLQDVAVSSGSACTTSTPEPSHVLRAMGLDETLARASLRFGLGRFNTAAEVERVVQCVAGAVRALRGLRVKRN